MIGVVMGGAMCRLCKQGRLSFDERTRYYALPCWRCQHCGELYYDDTIYKPVQAYGLTFVRIGTKNVKVHPMTQPSKTS